MILSPTISINREGKFEPQYEVVAIHLEGTCPRECGHTHIAIKANDGPKTQQDKQIQQRRYAHIAPKKCYKKGDECDKNDFHFNKFRPFCYANGCTERGPTPLNEDRFSAFNWRMEHDCEANFEGSTYVRQPLPQLTQEHLAHNAKIDVAKGMDQATRAKLINSSIQGSAALAARHTRKRKRQELQATMEQPQNQVSKKASQPTPLTPDPHPEGSKRKLVPKVPEFSFSALPTPAKSLPSTPGSDSDSQMSTDDFIATTEQKLKELVTSE